MSHRPGITPHVSSSLCRILVVVAASCVLPALPAEALTISNVQVSPLEHGATVTWTTDQPANGNITIQNGSYGVGISHADLTTSHSLTLVSPFILPENESRVNIQSQPSNGNGAVAGPFSFYSSPDVTPPMLSNFQVLTVASRSAVIGWELDELTGIGTVQYGPTAAYGQTAQAASIPCPLFPLTCYSRQLPVLTGLQPSQVYQFQLHADDAHGHQTPTLGNFSLATDTVWTQYGFTAELSPYYATCAAVGDATGCASEHQYRWPKEFSWVGNELLIHFNADASDLTRGPLRLDVYAAYVAQVGGEWVQLQVAAGTASNSLTVVAPGTSIDRTGVFSFSIAQNLFAPGANYIRLRATNIDASEMGFGHVAPTSVWNRMVLRWTDAPPLTEAQLLDRTEAQAARYFWDQAFTTNGFVRDITNSSQASMAATGFGLAALAVMADRSGTSADWTVTPAQAKARAQKILDAAAAIQGQQAADPARYGKKGFFYHFVEQDGQRTAGVEVSTVDTALFLAGALTAGQYFGGNVKTRAEQIFQSADWTYFFSSTAGRFYHAWKPEEGGNFTVPAPDGNGRLSTQQWDRPSDETLLVSLLALARDPAHLGFRQSLYGFQCSGAQCAQGWPRAVRSYGGYDVVNSFFGSLFTNLFATCFFDLETLGLDNPSAVGANVQPVNWFLNAKNAALANRQFVTDQASTSLTYGANQWGLSACYRPDGSYFGDNGAKPSECSFNPVTGQCGFTPAPPQSGEPHHDGTVPPYGAVSAMPLVRTAAGEALSQNLAVQALQQYYTAHFGGLWGPYGPRDALRTVLQGGQPVTAYSPLHVGIDVGPEALMIENYRSRLVQRYFMSHPGIQAALQLQFPSAGNRPPVANAGPDQTAPANSSVTLNGCASSDPDGNPLTFTWRNATGAVVGATCSITRAGPGGAGTATFRLTVSDGRVDVSDEVVVTWTQPPSVRIDAPTLNSVVDRTQPVVVSGVATAPPGGLISGVSYRVENVTASPPQALIIGSTLAVGSYEVFPWSKTLPANLSAGNKLRFEIKADSGGAISNPAVIYINPDGTVTPCYVLTAAYGDPYAPQIQALFTFRERFIPMTRWHQAFIGWYDRRGPAMAAVVRRHPLLQALIRTAVTPAAAAARWWLDR